MTDRIDIEHLYQAMGDAIDRQQAKRAERRRLAMWLVIFAMGSAVLGTILHIIARVAHP